MANVESQEDGADETQQCDDYDEQIEVIEQYVEETRDQSVVGDVKELIFDSPLPAYIPALPPGFEVDSFYVCEECGDRFTVESSYQFHRDRRSLLIKYDCAECGTTVTSYNRCNLLAHLRLHGNPSHLNLDWARVFISPLPFDKLLIGPLLNNAENEGVLSTELTNTNDNSNQCTECEVQVQRDLRSHFLGAGNGVPEDQSHKCKYCQMILPTKCSLKAHERYHRQERPYVCPDCAKVFSMWASFCVHLFYCCFHLDKCVRYRCPACKMFLSTSVALEVHILTMHVKNVFKCNACPIACFSLQTLEEHKVKGHGHTSLPTNAYQQCQLCPDRLIPKYRLLFHVIEHVRKPTVCVYGYQCSSCRLFYQKKSDFAEHKSHCSEQSSSNSSDARNGVASVKANGQTDGLTSTNLTNNHSSLASSEVSNTSRKENSVRRGAIKTAAYQVRSHGSQVPKESNIDCTYAERQVMNWGDKKTDEPGYNSLNAERPVSVSNSVVNNTDNVLGEHEYESTLVNANTHLCETCGQEFVKNIDSLNNSDTGVHCTNCSKEIQIPKPRSRKNSSRSEPPMKVSKASNNRNDKTKNSAKRGKNSIAFNGPCNKKIRLSTPEGTDKDKYKCHICKALIGTEWEAIQDHFGKEHKNFNLLVLSPRINKIEINENKSSNSNSNAGKEKKVANSNGNKHAKIKSEPTDKDREAEESPDPKSKRPRRKMPPRGNLNSTQSEKSGHSSCNQNQTKNEGKRTCFKCKFQSNDCEEFWSHIASHKTDSRAYQCMECGMCFVVKPSFQKHLFISHKIKDVEKYIKDHILCHQKPKSDNNPSQSDDAGGEENEELEENQCRVCRLKFETSVELNKHFRTHGMAFLMMKQQENRSSVK